jgi:hypothetical protein
MQKISLVFVCSVLALLLVGCGPPPTKLVPASGTVTYNGEPVEGATVTFLVEGNAVVADGKTGADGKFSLSTGGQPGAPAGKATVGVSKQEGGGAETGPMTKEEMMKLTENPAMTTDEAPKDLLPTKYASPGTSGLSFEIKADGGNEFSIELKD